MQRRPIRPPDLNGSFLTAIKRACREARGRPIRRLRRLPRLWACSRPPSRRPRPPRRWARPPGRAERGYWGFGCPPVLTRGGGISGGGRGDAGRGVPARGRIRKPTRRADPTRGLLPNPEARVSENKKKRLFSSTSLLMKRAANCSSSSADGTLGRSGPPAHLLGAREIFMAVRNREYSRGGGSVDVPMNLDLVAEVVSLVRSNYGGRPAAGRRRHEITPQGTSCPDLDRARALRCYSGTSIF